MTLPHTEDSQEDKLTGKVAIVVPWAGAPATDRSVAEAAKAITIVYGA